MSKRICTALVLLVFSSCGSERSLSVADAIIFQSNVVPISGNWEDDQGVAYFHYKNAGVVPIAFLGCKTDCNCISCEDSIDTDIPPKAERVLAVIVSFKSKQGDFIQTISPQFAVNGSQFTKDLKLTAHMPVVYKISDTGVIWNENEAETEKCIQILTTPSHPMRVLEIEEDKPDSRLSSPIRWSFEPNSSKTGYNIKIKPLNPTSRFFCRLLIHTDLPIPRLKTIHISALYVGNSSQDLVRP